MSLNVRLRAAHNSLESHTLLLLNYVWLLKRVAETILEHRVGVEVVLQFGQTHTLRFDGLGFIEHVHLAEDTFLENRL